MSALELPQALDLENDPIWRESCDIAEHIYSQLSFLPEEERFTTERNLRFTANYLMFMTSQAIGNGKPSGGDQEWGGVRQQAASLYTMYRFAGKQKFIELDPNIMMRIKKLIKEIDKKLEEAYKQTKEHNEEEMKRWQERYRIWKEIDLEKRGENKK